jgi:hypothetical protein
MAQPRAAQAHDRPEGERVTILIETNLLWSFRDGLLLRLRLTAEAGPRRENHDTNQNDTAA